MNAGRNMYEPIRTVKPLQTTTDGNKLTPADWQDGDDILVKSIPNADVTISDSSYYKFSWFMIFKKIRIIESLITNYQPLSSN